MVKVGSKERYQGYSRCSGEHANAGGSKIQASCLLSAFIVCVCWGGDAHFEFGVRGRESVSEDEAV